MFTLHGAIMVFLFIIPSIPAALGNFVLPLMLGAKDVAFPRLNLASLYIYLDRRDLGADLRSSPGGVDTGLDLLHAVQHHRRHGASASMTHGGVHRWASRPSSPGINFIATIHKLRAPGMGWFDMPLFCWGMYATALIQVLATPVLAITLLLLVIERVFRIGIFDREPGRRPGSVPALLLVLLASGRVHHDCAGHGDASARSFPCSREDHFRISHASPSRASRSR